MTDMTNLTTQQIHHLGVDSAITASRYHNDALILSSSGKYYVNTVYGLREVIFCCSTSSSSKSGDRINCNVSKREYQNRFVHEGYFDDKIYILVHMNLETGKHRFFKISHHDLCMIQYATDCIRSGSFRSIDQWLYDGKSRSNVSCDSLATAGFEVWK